MPIPEWIAAVRAMIGTDLLVTISSAAMVVNEKHEILLQKRTDNGLWGLPGGIIEPGEEPAQTAIREVYEETGLHVEAVELVGIFGGEQQRIIYPDGAQTVYVNTTFMCRVIDGTLTPDLNESSDVRWFRTDDLPASLDPAYIREIEAYLRGELPYYVLSDTFRPSNSSYIPTIRKKIGNTRIMMPGCDVLIFNDEGHLLVQKRSDNGM